MQFINAPICDVTGTPLPYGAEENMLSLEALETPPAYDKARIAVKFNDHSRRIIHKLKYQDQQHIAPLMAKMMHRAAVDIMADEGIICAVPLYHWRYVKRRFNQADLLARNLAKLAEIDYMPKLVKRVKWTKTQVGLSRKERRGNVKDAFKVNDEWAQKARGKVVYIVDDVITTGATADELAKILKQAGLGPIVVLAFAKVIQEKVI